MSNANINKIKRQIQKLGSAIKEAEHKKFTTKLNEINKRISSIKKMSKTIKGGGLKSQKRNRKKK